MYRCSHQLTFLTPPHWAHVHVSEGVGGRSACLHRSSSFFPVHCELYAFLPGVCLSASAFRLDPYPSRLSR